MKQGPWEVNLESSTSHPHPSGSPWGQEVREGILSSGPAWCDLCCHPGHRALGLTLCHVRLKTPNESERKAPHFPLHLASQMKGSGLLKTYDVFNKAKGNAQSPTQQQSRVLNNSVGFSASGSNSFYIPSRHGFYL